MELTINIGQIVGAILIFMGLFFMVSAVVGIIRFPDFYTRAHAAGMSDNCGVPMLIWGLAFFTDSSAHSIKLMLLGALILIISPAISHGLVKTAWINKHPYYNGDNEQ